MKRVLTLLLTLAILCSLGACGIQAALSDRDVVFYYPRNGEDPENYRYGSADGLITPEEREASGREENLKYLLNVYFRGPVSDDLVSPFPRDIRLEDITRKNTALTVSVSGSFGGLSDMDMTLAAACLSRTCFGLTDAQSVTFTVPAEDYALTLTQQDLILVDDSVSTEESTQ